MSEPTGGPVNGEFPSQAMIGMLSSWQFPLVAGVCWWAMLAALFWVHAPPPHHDHHFHPDHDQLPVPDEIEDTGEHAIFA